MRCPCFSWLFFRLLNPCTGISFIISKFFISTIWREAKTCRINWAPSSKFVSSSTPSWQILTAHAQPFRGARDLAFCLKVPLDSLLVWASSGGSGETARMHRLAWTFAARIGDKYQICLTRPNWCFCPLKVKPATFTFSSFFVCKLKILKKNLNAVNNSTAAAWVRWLVYSFLHYKTTNTIIWASSRENLFSGFATR